MINISPAEWIHFYDILKLRFKNFENFREIAILRCDITSSNYFCYVLTITV